MNDKRLLEMAEMQLRGFCHARDGHGVVELIESMNLSRTEWNELRDQSFIRDAVRAEIDEYWEAKL